MAPRLSKRQLREQAELEELEAASASKVDVPEPEDSDDDDDNSALIAQNTAATTATQPVSAFSALGDHIEDDQDDKDDQEDEETADLEQEMFAAQSKSKKKKKKKAKKSTATSSPAGDLEEEAHQDIAADSAPDQQLGKTPASKKKKKKGTISTSDTPRKGALGTKNDDNDGVDEIDRALAEIAKRAGGDTAAEIASTQASAAARSTPESQSLKRVLAFEPKLLDSDAELRKMFGSKVVQSQPSSGQPRSPYHARLANNPHHSTSIKRSSSFLANPEPGWYPPTGVLKVTRYEGPEVDQEPAADWYTFDHPVEYRAAQLGFMEVLQQADGNRLYNILQQCPYHVDTHMQLSEMQTQQGDLGAASTHLSKALYAMSQPLPASFPSGSFRLPYNRIENRAFFLGVARKVALLTKRGTWRTAFEWAKIGLGVSGGADPVGMLVFLDMLAPKARQYDWFMDALETLPKAYPHQPEMRLESYPGLAYAKALCLRAREEDKGQDDIESTAALKSAIVRFPMVVPLLMATLGGNVPPQVLSHRRAQVDGAFTTSPSYMLSLLSALYAHRSGPLWKPPPVLAWLQKTASTVAGSLDDVSSADVQLGERLFDQGPFLIGDDQGHESVPSGLIRATYIADVPALRPYIPPVVLSSTSYSYDPVPPSPNSGATFYDDDYFRILYGRVNGHGASGGGMSKSARRRLREQQARGQRDMAAQLAQLLGLGPQGPQVDLNPELRAELLAELDQLRIDGAAAGGGLPGGFPGGEHEEQDEDENEDEEDDFEDAEGDTDDEDEAQAQAQQNVFQRLAAFLGGAQGPADAAR